MDDNMEKRMWDRAAKRSAAGGEILEDFGEVGKFTGAAVGLAVGMAENVATGCKRRWWTGWLDKIFD